ncbi:TadE/TadG family type IV pilus assembly protein [Streptomyces benahoarensis]|uniref:Pilus assembly protein n=1 Tax=Streptomyces benahoarensis TaxID=2595054 RepID=A0A553YUM4_9ACTN|nr:TadE/TadG family type IV pilus assembly protein [Streptomyces benahoarensis]TSB32884.1 pilus assembly protein [Streptomyces benahoarensis]
MSRTPFRGTRRTGPGQARTAGPGPTRTAGPGASRTARDRGQASIEFLGFLPLLLVVALAVVQLGIAAFAVQQAGTGARAAARTASLDPLDRPRDPAAAGRAAMTGWVADRARIGVDGAADAVRATATVTLPSLIPGVSLGTVSRSATMPRPAAAHVPGAAPEGVLAP